MKVGLLLRTLFGWFFLFFFVGFLSVVKGFTQGQRNWLLRRSGNRCEFHQFNSKTGKWLRCKNTRDLQAHHLIPRGWAMEHLPHWTSEKGTDRLNSNDNGIILCSRHHIGKGVLKGDIYVIHPDNQDALEKYRSGNTHAFSDMMETRKEKNKNGVPYWNTLWDSTMRLIIQRRNLMYLKKYPRDIYPRYRKSNNGRRKQRNGQKLRP